MRAATQRFALEPAGLCPPPLPSTLGGRLGAALRLPRRLCSALGRPLCSRGVRGASSGARLPRRRQSELLACAPACTHAQPAAGLPAGPCLIRHGLIRSPMWGGESGNPEVDRSKLSFAKIFALATRQLLCGAQQMRAQPRLSNTVQGSEPDLVGRPQACRGGARAHRLQGCATDLGQALTL